MRRREEAAVRETKEEVGIDIVDVKHYSSDSSSSRPSELLLWSVGGAPLSTEPVWRRWGIVSGVLQLLI